MSRYRCVWGGAEFFVQSPFSRSCCILHKAIKDLLVQEKEISSVTEDLQSEKTFQSPE